MSDSGSIGAAPAAWSWVAAVHHSRDDLAPLGSAVVVDELTVLTAAHVLPPFVGGEPADVWVAFPFADSEGLPGRTLAKHVRPTNAAHADLAVLELATPVPAGVLPAPVRRPPPPALQGKRWWAFGFPGRDWHGNDAEGLIGRALGYGWVRLDTDSRYLVETGFSGAGLWCPDYGAVVGVVGQANDRGDGHALALHRADRYLRAEKIELLSRWDLGASDDVARQAWGWSLADDREADRHWRPRSRGVMSTAETGYRFRGRTTALRQIRTWLDRPVPDRTILVITGSPGAGKSAVLGRIVVTADRRFTAGLAEQAGTVRATPASVACAVHAKGKTALDIAREIARAVSAPLPDRVQDLPIALRATLSEQAGRRFNLVIDALDEASDASETRTVVRDLVLPIATECADVGAQVVVGTRRFDAEGELLAMFAPGLTLIDLDDPQYFAVEDLAAYALATLQLHGAERDGNPYQQEAVAAPVALRIAELAQRNFLVAGLVARTHGLYDHQPISPGHLQFTARVDDVLTDYLGGLPAVNDATATEVLTALAYVEAPGVPARLWCTIVHALTGRKVNEYQLGQFAHRSAANFLVESSTAQEPVYRLFHQALNDALTRRRTESEDEVLLTRALMHQGRRQRWAHAPTYLMRSLPDHARRAGLVDNLLTDPDYLLHVDLRRLLLAASAPATEEGHQSLRMLGHTPAAAGANPPLRLAMFSVTEALDNLGTAFREHDGRAPFRAAWANVAPRVERATLDGHTEWVSSLCTIRMDDRDLLASASYDGTIQIWDPMDGTKVRSLVHNSPEYQVYAICTVRLGGRDLIASAGADGTIRIWDPAGGTHLKQLTGHTDWVNGLCAVRYGDRELIASASSDRTARVWNPVDGKEVTRFHEHRDEVYGICAITINKRTLIASASADKTVRIWDPDNGMQLKRLVGHGGPVTSVCALPKADRDLVVSGSNDKTVRIWDPVGGTELRLLDGHDARVHGVCSVRVSDQDLVASIDANGQVLVSDPRDGRERYRFTGHTDRGHAVSALRVNDRDVIASASADRTVRIWDMTADTKNVSVRKHGRAGKVDAICTMVVTGQDVVVSGGAEHAVQIWNSGDGRQLRQLTGHTSSVFDLCPIKIGDHQLIASASADETVRIWDPSSGVQLRQFDGHTSWVFSICVVRLSDHQLIASASADETVLMWDPTASRDPRPLVGHTDWVNAVCRVHVGGRDLVASASYDGTARLWDPTNGTELTRINAHSAAVNAVCATWDGDRDLIATASSDKTVRIWDPTTGAELHQIATYSEAFSVAAAKMRLFIGLDAGLLTVTVEGTDGRS